MGKGKALFIISIAIILIAYALDDPIPDGISQQWIVKLFLGLFKLVGYMSKCLCTMGFSEPVVYRNIIHFIANLGPVHADPEISVKDMAFGGVPVRVYTPVGGGKENKRGMVYYHGGGWTFGTFNIYDPLMAYFSKHLNVVVVSVDYRLAPENVFPAAVDDCEKATKHFINNAAVFGVDPAHVAVAGDSAGGNLAAVVSLRLRNSGFKLMPKLQVLIFPVLQGLSFDTPSYRAYQNGPFLTKDKMTRYVSTYLFGHNYKQYIHELYLNNHTTSIIKKSNAQTSLNVNILPDDNLRQDYVEHLDFGNSELWDKMQDKMLDPDFAPLFAKDHSRLPKAYISTCQYDVLRDDGYFYAQKLRDAKVDVTHVNVNLCYHSWVAAHEISDTFKKELTEIVKYIHDNL